MPPVCVITSRPFEVIYSVLLFKVQNLKEEFFCDVSKLEHGDSKKNVKFALEEAVKVQRENEGLALFFP